MERSSNYWLNVDIPTKKATLHALGCKYEIEKRETPLKGLGHLKRDGGWLGFASEADADIYARAKLSGYVIKKCGFCFKSCSMQ